MDEQIDCESFSNSKGVNEARAIIVRWTGTIVSYEFAYVLAISPESA
jgi:hypothetical protein